MFDFYGDILLHLLVAFALTFTIIVVMTFTITVVIPISLTVPMDFCHA